MFIIVVFLEREDGRGGGRDEIRVEEALRLVSPFRVVVIQ